MESEFDNVVDADYFNQIKKLNRKLAFNIFETFSNAIDLIDLHNSVHGLYEYLESYSGHSKYIVFLNILFHVSNNNGKFFYS